MIRSCFFYLLLLCAPFCYNCKCYYSHGKDDFKGTMKKSQDRLIEYHDSITYILNCNPEEIMKLSPEEIKSYEERIEQAMNFYEEEIDGFDANEKKVYDWVFLDLKKLRELKQEIRKTSVCHNS